MLRERNATLGELSEKVVMACCEIGLRSDSAALLHFSVKHDENSSATKEDGSSGILLPRVMASIAPWGSCVHAP